MMPLLLVLGLLLSLHGANTQSSVSFYPGAGPHPGPGSSTSFGAPMAPMYHIASATGGHYPAPMSADPYSAGAAGAGASLGGAVHPSMTSTGYSMHGAGMYHTAGGGTPVSGGHAPLDSGAGRSFGGFVPPYHTGTAARPRVDTHVAAGSGTSTGSHAGAASAHIGTPGAGIHGGSGMPGGSSLSGGGVPPSPPVMHGTSTGSHAGAASAHIGTPGARIHGGSGMSAGSGFSSAGVPPSPPIMHGMGHSGSAHSRFPGTDSSAAHFSAGMDRAASGAISHRGTGAGPMGRPDRMPRLTMIGGEPGYAARSGVRLPPMGGAGRGPSYADGVGPGGMHGGGMYAGGSMFGGMPGAMPGGMYPGMYPGMHGGMHRGVHGSGTPGGMSGDYMGTIYRGRMGPGAMHTGMHDIYGYGSMGSPGGGTSVGIHGSMPGPMLGGFR